MQFLSSTPNFCHNGSIQNYFNSPKMPVRDHIQGIKQTSSFFKHHQEPFDYKTKKILGKNLTQNHINEIIKIKNMKLMNTKQLHLVSHQSGKQNYSIGSHHDRQTNSGYSRNKLGGFFTS